MAGEPPRYAIYYAPAAGSALWRFGAGVLGYDAYSGAEVAQPDLGLSDGEMRAITDEPRRYGFHGTLKAPLHLREGCRAAQLSEACERFAASRRAVPLPSLKVAAIGPFLALVPVETPAALGALADACVETFDAFRAPLSPDDLARRLKAPLTASQRAHLQAWGYPYVFEDFRFHMTLTGSLPEPMRARMLDALEAAFVPLASEAVAIDAIALFRQDDRASPFVIERRFPLMSDAQNCSSRRSR